jgi:hypothetical protein
MNIVRRVYNLVLDVSQKKNMYHHTARGYQ